jgi:hypothetical protein
MTALTRSKVEPMVRGLFPRAERDPVLATLEKSVVFLTSSNIDLTCRRNRTCLSQGVIRRPLVHGSGTPPMPCALRLADVHLWEPLGCYGRC